MTTRDQSLTSQPAAADTAPTTAQQVLRVVWWLGALIVTVAVFVAMDRMAWVDGLAETTQTGLRVAAGAALIAVAGLLDPWAGPQRD